jgi:L-fucose isomerase-like protein
VTEPHRPLVALVAAHLPSYLAEEHGVFAAAEAGMRALAERLDFRLLIPNGPPLETRADAERAADACTEAGADLVLLLHGSFVMGDLVLPFADHGLRLGLWATAEPTKRGPIPLNNFVSMHLAAGVLARYLGGVPFKWFYGGVEHPWFAPRLATTVRALRGLKRLTGATVGLVGGLAPTFYNLAVDERALKANLGIEVGHHEFDEVLAGVAEAGDAEIDATVAAMAEAATAVELPPDAMRAGAAVYVALRRLAERGDYDALAVSDWPRFQSDLGLHPGMAFSWLDHHDGVPVAAEGDILGAASQLLMRGVSGAPAMLLDLNTVDEERGAVLMWHCGGSPLSFADDGGVRWTAHTTLGRKGPDEGKLGAVADLRFRPQPATIVRLLADGSSLLTLDARVIDSPHDGYDGSRGWLADFAADGDPLSLADLVNTVMVEGVDHHLILGSGHHDSTLREAATWMSLDILSPIPYRDHLQRPHPPNNR